jgi:hypothetical protein
LVDKPWRTRRRDPTHQRALEPEKPHVHEDPVRLILDFGWRELGFIVALALSVTLLFGLAPALRKGGEE